MSKWTDKARADLAGGSVRWTDRARADIMQTTAQPVQVTHAQRVARRDDGAARDHFAQTHPEYTGGMEGAMTRAANTNLVQAQAQVKDAQGRYDAATKRAAAQASSYLTGGAPAAPRASYAAVEQGRQVREAVERSEPAREMVRLYGELYDARKALDYAQTQKAEQDRGRELLADVSTSRWDQRIRDQYAAPDQYGRVSEEEVRSQRIKAKKGMIQVEQGKLRQEMDAQSRIMAYEETYAGDGWDPLHPSQRYAAAKERYDAAKESYDRLEADLNWLSGRDYSARNESGFGRLAVDEEAAGKYADAAKVKEDQQKLNEVIGYYQKGGGSREDYERIARLEEDLLRDYGLGLYAINAFVNGDDTPRAGEVSVRQVMERMEALLSTRKEALEGAEGEKTGYDFEDLYGYQRRIEKQQEAAKRAEETAKFAREHPVISSVGTALASPFQAVDLLNMDWGKGKPGDVGYIPPDASGMALTNAIQTVRGTISQDLARSTDWELWGQNVPAFLYNTGMSMADSALAISTLGTGSVYLMGLNSAVNTAKEVVDGGGTTDQALKLGLASGAAEILFEKFSVDSLLKPKTAQGWRDVLKQYVVQQGLVELSEEALTETANILAEVSILGQSSDYAKAVEGYRRAGDSEATAKQKAFLDMAGRVGWAGAGGFVSGAGMGAGKAAVDYAGSRLGDFDIRTLFERGRQTLARTEQGVYNKPTLTTTEGADIYGEQGTQLDRAAGEGVPGLPQSDPGGAEQRSDRQGDLSAAGGLGLTEDKAGYSRLLDEARAADPVNGWAVTPKSVEELADCRVFLSEDGGVGLAVAPDGDIEAVFRNKARHPQKGALKTALPQAIAEGGTKLDCYGRALVNVYAYSGFVPVARVTFDPEFANPGWTADKGTPDIYVMMATDLDADTVRSKQGSYKGWEQAELDQLPLMEYDQAMAYRDRLLAQRAGTTPGTAQEGGDGSGVGVDAHNPQTGENGASVDQDVPLLLKPALEVEARKQGKPSAQATAIMERLSKGEEVSLDEIYQIPEIAEVRSREHTDTSRVNTPERQQLRRDVLAQLQALGSYTGFDRDGDGGYNGVVRQERRADIVIGVPAAGKSSVLVNPLSQQHGSRIIDSDMAKERLPEFDGGKGAGDVHRESSMIRDELLRQTVKDGDNFVWPQVGKSLDGLVADILLLKDAGYEVHLHLNELSAGKATGRAINRFLTEGRYVDPGIVMGVGDAPTRNYETLRKLGGVLDGYSRYSNDVPRGTDPHRLESSEGGAGTSAPVAGDAPGGADRGGLRGGRPDGLGGAQTGGSGIEGGESQEGPGGADTPGVGAAQRGFAGAYDRLQGETPASGFHADGENAYRQQDVPMRDFDGRAIPKSAATVMEAQATPDAALGQIQEMIASGALSFDSITDKSALRRAEGEIRNTGYQKALGAWLEQTRRGVTSKDLVVKGQVLLNSAMNARATGDVVQILSAYTRLSTRAAQAMQAQRVLKKLSPEWQLYAVQQSIASYQEELNARLGEDAPTVTVDQDLYDAYVAASDPQEREAALMDIYQNVADQIPATFAEKWTAWRYLSMLGNPRTHIRNIVGNAGFAPVRGVKNAIAWGMENGVDIANKAAGGMGIEKTKAMIVPLLSRLNAQDGALVSACYQDLANVEEQLLGAGKYAQSAQGQIDQRRTVFKTKPLEAVRKANSAALDVEDTWFSRPVYAGALAGYLKAHKVTAQMLTEGTVKAETLDAARAYAVREAQKATYRDANAFSDLVARLGRLGEGKGKAGKAAHVLVEGVLPFKRTPANILARGVEYSPAGLVKGLTYDLVQVKNGNMTAAQAIDDISAGLTGTGLLALGFWLASMGLVTGGGGDEPEDQLRDLTGGQDYALTLPGGASVTLDWLAPEALPFFVGVEAFNYAQDHTDGAVDWKAVESAAVQITDPVMEMSMLQGLQDAVNEVKFSDDGLLLRLAANAGLSYLTQGVPTLFGQLERTAESERQSTYVDRQSGIPKEVQWMLGKVMNKLPGEFSQIPYIDAWGRREETGTALERAVNNLLNPAYGSRENKTPVDEEIGRLLEAGQTGVVPQRPAQSVKIGKEYLSAEEYVAYAEEKGQLSYQLVSDLIGDGAYKAMSDADKAKAISDAYGYANAMAKKKVKPQYEIPSEYAKAKRMLDAGLSLGEWLAMRSGADADDNDRTSRDELVAYIDAHVPKGRRRAVFDAYKGQQKWKNPY